MIKQRSVRSRVIMAVLEIVIGSILLMGIILILSSVLSEHGQLSRYDKFTIQLSDDDSATAIDQKMAKEAYDYALFDRQGRAMTDNGRMTAADHRIAEQAAQKRSVIHDKTVTFRVFMNRQVILVVRQNDLPELKNHQLRVVSYSNLIYLIVVVGELVLITQSIVRLVLEFSRNFKAIRLVALNLGQQRSALPARKKSRLSDFEDVLAHLEQKSDALGMLIAKEKNQKEDLSFQIAALAHDVKTPLTVLKGNLELLEMTRVSEQQQDFMTSMQTSVMTFERYFSAMIDYTKLITDDHYHDKIDFQSFLDDLVPEIEELLAHQRMTFHLRQQTAVTAVRGNALALRRTIMNIVMNATQHRAPDEPQVVMTLTGSDGFLSVAIWNNGVPFADDARKNATKLFYTSDSSRGGQHYGLGLAFANAVALKHDGCLILTNPPEGGATVTITIKITH